MGGFTDGVGFFGLADTAFVLGDVLATFAAGQQAFADGTERFPDYWLERLADLCVSGLVLEVLLDREDAAL